MKVMSAFSGIGSTFQALKELGIPYSHGESLEIDPYAQRIEDKHHPDVRLMGDITEYKGKGKFDLLTGGFPCQSWSFGGTQLGLIDPRGSLLTSLIKLKERLDPEYFLFENVPMRREYEDLVSDLIGCSPIKLDSVDFGSPAYRKRWYWTNIPQFKYPKIPNRYFGDIKEEYTKQESHRYGSSTLKVLVRMHLKSGKMMKIYGDRTIMSTLTASHSKSYGSARYLAVPEYHDKYKDYQRLYTGSQMFDLMYNHDRQALDVHLPNGKISHMTEDGSLKQFPLLRYVSVIEYSRAMGFPDDYLEGLSNTQQYKLLGNSWHLPTIKMLMRGLK